MKKQSIRSLFTALVVSILATACTDNNPEQQISSARDYLQKKDLKSATIQIKNALQKNPDLAEARFLLGTILLNDGNPGAAEIELRKALAAKHPPSLVVPELARALMMMGQAKNVVDEFGTIKLEKPAADAILQSMIATAYGTLGKPDLAKTALNAALNADPNSVPALIERARQMALGRDFIASLVAVEQVIAREPGNADAWKLKGDILLYAKNREDDALAAYRKSIEVNPTFGLGHIAVLTVLMQQGKVDAAAKQLDQLKVFAANNPQTKYFEAWLAYQKKDYKLARELSQQMMRLAPGSPQILQLAGAIELQMNSLVQAEIYLAKATQAAPELALARQLLITTYLRSGQSANALATLNAGTGKDGLNPRMFSLAGEVYLQNGDAKTAEEYFAKALKLDPDNVAKRTALAVTHLASGQTATALDELANIALSDTGTSADMALISAHLRRKEFDKALVAIDKLEAKQPDKPVAANLRGRVQLAQKDTIGARKSFERALAIAPSYFAAVASLAALDIADNKPEVAKRRFQSLLTKNPKNGQALLAMAELAALRGAGNDEVAGYLTKAVEANPTEIAPRLLLIELYLKTNDNKHAASAAEGAVAAIPTAPELLDALGRVQQASGDLNQAVATFGKLAAMQPLSPQPHVRLAAAHMANKSAWAAEQSLRKALAIKVDHLDAQRALIILDLEAKKYDQALAIARTVQAQRPEAGAGFVFEGDIKTARKDWDGAVALYRLGLQKVQSPELAIKLHAALLESGKAAEAERFAATWLKSQPKDSRLLSYLGVLAITHKNYVAAEKSYLALLQIQPESAAALNNLAWVSHQLRKDGALAYAEKAHKLAPNEPAFMDTLAVLMSDKGQHPQAIELQLKALQLQPLNTAFRLNLAKIYIAAGDKDRAKTELDALVKLGDKNPTHAEVLQLLKAT